MGRLTFRHLEEFAPAARAYQLLPFRFIDLAGRVLLVNEVGEHHLVELHDFARLAQRTLSPDSDTYLDLKAKHFICDSNPGLVVRLLATKYRTKRDFLRGFTALHIFVVTLRCDTSCSYCQVSRVSANRQKYDMTPETADKALDLVFRSPSEVLKIEFQGGEPLLNLDLIRHITLKAKERNQAEGRDLQFVVTTNLSTLTDEALTFFKEEGLFVSTSLDGPAFLHNANRPRPENDAYERTVRGIAKAKEALGHDAVSALMTTTRQSLEHPEAIVDEYVNQGFDHIFLRPMSPYGFAAYNQVRLGYNATSFLEFYKRALQRIVAVNRAGYAMSEFFAQLLMTKMLTPFATGYVDLQSPSGAGISAAVYNYDGDVYPSDESRMLAEMGDRTFRLGNVHQNTYEEMFGGELLRSLVQASCVESLPGCSDCALQTYCGADPVENYATQGNIFGHRPTSAFCQRNMGIMKHLLSLYYGEDSFVRELFRAWVQRCSVEHLYPRLPA